MRRQQCMERQDRFLDMFGELLKVYKGIKQVYAFTIMHTSSLRSTSSQRICICSLLKIPSLLSPAMLTIVGAASLNFSAAVVSNKSLLRRQILCNTQTATITHEVFSILLMLRYFRRINWTLCNAKEHPMTLRAAERELWNISCQHVERPVFLNATMRFFFQGVRQISDNVGARWEDFRWIWMDSLEEIRSSEQARIMNRSNLTCVTVCEKQSIDTYTCRKPRIIWIRSNTRVRTARRAFSSDILHRSFMFNISKLLK